MNVLIGCEESQIICKAFRAVGHNAYSCDLVSCSGGHPEWHIIADVLSVADGCCTFETQAGSIHVLLDAWDLVILHPPCTYLSNAGAGSLFSGGNLNKQRFFRGLLARNFFYSCLNVDCPRICVENPTPSKIYELPTYSQIIQPYYFGEPFSKRTLLWLVGLPPLFATSIILDYEATTTAAWYNKGGNSRQRNRSKTFPGIAAAMAAQWGTL